MSGEITDNMSLLFPDQPVLKGERICIRPLVASDAPDLAKLTKEEEVYRYLPTYLFEKKYPDTKDVIEKLYTEGLVDSLIMGVFMRNRFCGLAEVYGYRGYIHKASVGYRFLKEEWGKGIATEALNLMIKELIDNRGIEIITASTMVENRASAHVLQKAGFMLVNSNVDEDWGFPEPTPADKWIL